MIKMQTNKLMPSIVNRTTPNIINEREKKVILLLEDEAIIGMT